jgi:DNA-binding IclR family transcriptional regulator
MILGNDPAATDAKSGKNAVSKALQLLACLIDRGRPMGVQALAARTGFNASTVHRLLQTLVEERMASHDPEARLYSVGGECIRLATATLSGRSLVGRVRPVVRDVANRLGETCALYLYEPLTKTMIAAVVEHGPQPLGYGYDVGQRASIHAGASGRAILAFLPPSDVEGVLQGPLERHTETTLIEPDRLRGALAKVVADGYAVSHGERGPHGCGVAVPVIPSGGRVVGSLGLSIPKFRFREAAAPEIAVVLQNAARDLTAVANFDADDERA